MTDKPTGIARIVKATGYSIAGLKSALRHEAAFRQESALAVIMVPAGLWLGNGPVEKALLVSCVLLVLVVELLNSAAETIVDRIGIERHELSGRAKDQGSAAVLIALFNAAAVWGLLLYDDVAALLR